MKDVQPGMTYVYVVKTNGAGPGFARIPDVAVSNSTNMTRPGQAAAEKEYPITVSATASAGQVTITWTEKTLPGEVVQYNTYRMDHEIPEGVIGGDNVGTVTPGEKQFTDTTAVAGQVYYYKVVATVKVSGGNPPTQYIQSSQAFATAQ